MISIRSMRTCRSKEMLGMGRPRMKVPDCTMSADSEFEDLVKICNKNTVA